MSKLKDETGNIYGRLTVIRRVENTKANKAQWLCLCECGAETVTVGCDLRNRRYKSCGCWNKEDIDKTRIKHGLYNEFYNEFNSWKAMVSRCTNKKDVHYSYYGGRGITVCDRWLESFANFLEDMGTKPEKSYSIDRINTNGGYEPSNCRWVNQTIQVRNRRVQRNNKLGVTGVFWNKQHNRYQANIKHQGKNIYLGVFKTIEEAQEARKQAELKYWKET